MNEPTYAFVTLLTSSWYLPGTLVLGHALRALHPRSTHAIPFKLVCIVTPETVDAASIKALSDVWDTVVGVEVLEHVDQDKGLELLGRRDLNTVLTKLHVFRLTSFTKVIFLDADVLPLRPISHLFALPHSFSASPDTGWPDCFNSGVLVLEPSKATFDGLMELLKGNGESDLGQGSFDGGDQGILNQYFNGEEGRPAWNRISFTYNTTPTAAYTYAPAYAHYGRQIHCVHFIGAQKPWSTLEYRVGQIPSFHAFPNTEGAYDYSNLVDRWYAVYDKYVRPRQSQRKQEAGTWEVPKTLAAWDQPFHQGSGERLGLEELKQVAEQGWGNGQGRGYISLPLEGRFSLIRPQPKALNAVEPFPPYQASPPSVNESADQHHETKQAIHAPDPHSIQPGIPYFAQWDPARSSPPKNQYQMQVDINQHYKNTWDLSGKEAKERERAWMAGQGTRQDAWKLPDEMNDGRYNVSTHPANHPRPDPAMPWNSRHRKTPSRVFPRGDTPPVPEVPEVPTAPRPGYSSSGSSRHAPPLPLQIGTSSFHPQPALSFEEAMRSYHGNAWDSLPGIKNYASKLQGSRKGLSTDRGRRESKELETDWRTGERSSDRGTEGDDEGEDSDDEGSVEDGARVQKSQRSGRQYAVSAVQTELPPLRDTGVQSSTGTAPSTGISLDDQPFSAQQSDKPRGRVWSSSRDTDELKQQNSGVLARFLHGSPS